MLPKQENITLLLVGTIPSHDNALNFKRCKRFQQRAVVLDFKQTTSILHAILPLQHTELQYNLANLRANDFGTRLQHSNRVSRGLNMTVATPAQLIRTQTRLPEPGWVGFSNVEVCLRSTDGGFSTDLFKKTRACAIFDLDDYARGRREI